MTWGSSSDSSLPGSVRELTVAGLTVYAVEHRYVAGAADSMDLVERPTWDEADEAIEVAGVAVAAATHDLDPGRVVRGHGARAPARLILRRGSDGQPGSGSSHG